MYRLSALTFILLTLTVASDVTAKHTTSSNGSSPLGQECARCSPSRPCKSGLLCFAARCVSLDTKRAERCLGTSQRPVCAPCRTHGDCASARCLSGRCAPGRTGPLAPGALRRVCPRFRGAAESCAICRRDYDCHSGRCFRMRCSPVDRAGFVAQCQNRTPRPACARCSRTEQCSGAGRGMKCRAGRCDDGSDRTRRMCFRDACDRCGQGWQCESGGCRDGRCDAPDGMSCKQARAAAGAGSSTMPPTTTTAESMKTVTAPRPPLEKDVCASCDEAATSGGKCASGETCMRGKCVAPGVAGVKKCFPRGYALPECAACSAPDMCEQGMCWGGRCTDGSETSLGRCFLRECMRCVASSQCATKACYGGWCVRERSSNAKAECEKRAGGV